MRDPQQQEIISKHTIYVHTYIIYTYDPQHYIYTNIHTYVHIYIYISIYVYTYVCVYMQQELTATRVRTPKGSHTENTQTENRSLPLSMLLQQPHTFAYFEDTHTQSLYISHRYNYISLRRRLQISSDIF